MAATAVYARLAPIPTATTAYIDNGKAFSNISATTAAFTITVGGLFMFNVKASTYGTVGLQVLGPDDTTWLPVDIQTGTATVTAGTVQGVAATFGADGSGLVWLAAGQYRVVIA